MVRIQVIIKSLPSVKEFAVNSTGQLTYTESLGVPIPEMCYSGLGRQIHSRAPPGRRIASMSIMVWQVLRRLPKPLLLALLFFLRAAVVRT